nr:hypothetical protein GCM10020241_34700 [Streptoalloteichus tenebrarius]
MVLADRLAGNLFPATDLGRLGRRVRLGARKTRYMGRDLSPRALRVARRTLSVSHGHGQENAREHDALNLAPLQVQPPPALGGEPCSSLSAHHPAPKARARPVEEIG